MRLYLSEIIEKGSARGVSLGSTRDFVLHSLSEPEDYAQIKKKIEIFRYNDLQLVLDQGTVSQLIIQPNDKSDLFLDENSSNAIDNKITKDDLLLMFKSKNYVWRRESSLSFLEQESVRFANGTVFIFDYGSHYGLEKIVLSKY